MRSSAHRQPLRWATWIRSRCRVRGCSAMLHGCLAQACLSQCRVSNELQYPFLLIRIIIILVVVVVDISGCLCLFLFLLLLLLLLQRCRQTEARIEPDSDFLSRDSSPDDQLMLHNDDHDLNAMQFPNVSRTRFLSCLRQAR